MKLQKVVVVLGISVCLIATQMQATFGIGETEQEENPELTEEEPDKPAEPVVSEKPAIMQEPASPEEPVIVEEPESPKEPVRTEDPADSKEPVRTKDPADSKEPVMADEPVQPKEPEEPVITGKPAKEEIPKDESIFEIEIPKGEEDSEGEIPKDEDGSGKEEIPKDENGSGEEETPKKEDGSGEEELPKEEDGSDKEELPKEEDGSDKGELPKEEDGSDKEELPKEEDSSGKEELPKEEDNSAVEDVPKEEDSEKDNKDIEGLIDNDGKEKDNAGNNRSGTKKKEQKTKGAEAAGKTSKRRNIFSSFTPSSEFLDNREKVKYNVDVPVDGLPGFITQEMLVGALKCQDETGYPASVTIAQIIQESGFGKYGPDGDKGQGLSYLAYQYNNLFGIKGSGTAGSVAMNTGEQRVDGSRYNITAGFRVYNTYTECIEDRTGLLDRVYKDLTFGVKDANTFAMKIGQRWATSLSYGQHLIGQMERYDLYRLDAMTLDEFSSMIGTFANPCPGARLTSSFGYREAPLAGASTYHKGVDLGTGAYNIPTYAAQAGTVIFAGPSGAAGNLVTIDHGNGLITKYMHHDKIYVKAGDKVEKGQQIGLSGTTGNSTGNHLHFQVEKNGVVINPLLYLDIQ